MSPTSPAYYPKVENSGGGGSEGTTSRGVRASAFPFGVRTKPPKAHAEKVSVAALKVCSDSHGIRKPPRPLPQVQHRAPVIIHTYSPKVIHTDPGDFMSLVQHLTGSSDTRLRIKRRKPKKPKPPAPTPSAAAPNPPPVEAGDHHHHHHDQDCGSPSSSQDSESPFVSTLGSGDAKSVKQSTSPRGPLSNFEFDNTFTSEVKSEPAEFDNCFNFFTGLKPLPKPPSTHHGYSVASPGYYINSPLPSPGFLSPGNWLPELSPGTAAWSQTFLDCLNGSPRLLADQPPLHRQKSSKPSDQGTMVALESIQAFITTK